MTLYGPLVIKLDDRRDLNKNSLSDRDSDRVFTRGPNLETIRRGLKKERMEWMEWMEGMRADGLMNTCAT